MTNKLPCGHELNQVVQADEGTAYCTECERIGRIEANRSKVDVRAPRKEFVEAMRHLWKSFIQYRSLGYYLTERDPVRQAVKAFAEATHDTRFHSVSKTCGKTCLPSDVKKLEEECGL